MGKGKKDAKKEALVEDQEYYHGFLDRQDLPFLLNENGDFLVRMAELAGEAGEKGAADAKPQAVISVMYDKALPKVDDQMRHFVIQKSSNAKKKYSIQMAGFPSIPELVDFYVSKKEGINTKNSTTPAYLKQAINRQAWELSHEDITQVKKLGEGAFGEVWLGKLRTKTKRKIDVALKIAKAEQALKDKIKELMKEARLMRNFEHPNIVKLYGVAVEQEPLMLVMELVEGGGLDDYLKKNRGKVSIDEKSKQMVMGAAWGLEYLHSKMCIHRDIAARNCLYNGKLVKISDFGLSREGNIYQMTTVKRLPLKWLAPETLQTGTYSLKSDVFSFGILVWEIYANGEEPYQGMTNAEVQKQVTDGFRLEMDPEAPEEIVDIITKQCWEPLPNVRWKMSQVCRALEGVTKCKAPAANKELAKKKPKGAEATMDDGLTSQDRTVDKTTCNEETVDEPAKEEEKKEGKKGGGTESKMRAAKAKPKVNSKETTRRKVSTAPSKKKK